MIAEELNRELEKIKSAALSGANNAIDKMTSQIMDDAQKKVYSYPASSFAKRTRRGAENGGVGSREAINLYATIDGNDLEIWGKVSRGLQHPTSKDGSKTWGADAVDVVESGNKAFKQPKPRPFIDEDSLNSILEDSLYEALYDWL